MTTTNPSFWKNKKVLITGHTGFKGSWLSLWLSSMGANVIGYALEPPTNPNMFQAIGLEELITSIHGDVRDHDNLLAVFKAQKPEMVFHLAAQPLVRVSYKEPRTTYETNVMGTVNVLEAVRKTPSVRVVINVTSDKCYENREWVWGYRENDPMGGHDPYSSSKGCSELVAAAYIKSFFAPPRFGVDHNVVVASVRAGNVIGGGDWGLDRLVPDCVRAITSNQDISIRYPNAFRPWQHVLEPLSGYMLLAEKLWNSGAEYTGAWNFGPGENETWSVGELTRHVYRLWGREEPRNLGAESRVRNPHEAGYLKLDCSKARSLLGWAPRYSLQQALSETVAWYNGYYSGLDSRELSELTFRQISTYMNDHGTGKVGVEAVREFELIGLSHFFDCKTDSNVDWEKFFGLKTD